MVRSRRRSPKQHRAKQTVAAVLDAVVRVLKRDGASRVTTNRIAQVAGVSVGSVYQYFADKRAIFVALRDRHVAEMGQLVERRLVQNAGASLDALVSDGYMRKLPDDPFTMSSSTWQTVPSEPDANNPTASPGIYDVKSGSEATALDGTKYADW